MKALFLKKKKKMASKVKDIIFISLNVHSTLSKLYGHVTNRMDKHMQILQWEIL